MEEKVFIVRNLLKTPDGTILESRQKGEALAYTDTVTKKDYFIDGGIQFVRHSQNGDEELLTITSENSFDIIRESLVREFDAGPSVLVKRLPLKEWTKDQISFVKEYLKSLKTAFDPDWIEWYLGLLNQELGWRAAIETNKENERRKRRTTS